MEQLVADLLYHALDSFAEQRHPSSRGRVQGSQRIQVEAFRQQHLLQLGQSVLVQDDDVVVAHAVNVDVRRDVLRPFLGVDPAGPRFQVGDELHRLQHLLPQPFRPQRLQRRAEHGLEPRAQVRRGRRAPRTCP